MRISSAELLEFDDLKRLLRGFISSPLGARELDMCTPIADRPLLGETHSDNAETLEYERVFERPQPPAKGATHRIRFHDIPDCEESLAQLRIEGAVLDGKQLLGLTALLDKALEIRSALAFSQSTYPRLAARASAIADLRPVLRDLSGKILPDGSLADDASVALKRLRREAEKQHGRIQDSLERFLRQHREDEILQEEFVTIRNDRFVVPIVSGKQRRIDGVIHGASGTGHTLFVEPLETIEHNNELVRLTEEALQEEHRILRDLTSRLRKAHAEIDLAKQVVGELEFLFAKARFAIRFDAVIPRFSSPDSRRLLLRDARHPLLEDVLRRQKKEVVPISLDLSNDQSTLLISGPNTGGKTVTLKTVGLFCLMAQAGIPVPCAEAELPIFSEVLADIGDNQSIAESLSTFSAHIARIREMVEEVGPDSLVLLDELGRATDPEEGGALGVAVLDDFRSAGALTLASTHLLALKVYGANTDGVVNGSMGFDDETLQPTYRLRTGAPGKSAGLDIASRLGLPAELIARARRNMSSSERDIAEFLNRLHARLEDVAKLERELTVRNRELAAEKQHLTQLWERREKAKLAELERRAEDVLDRFEGRAAETIREIEQDAAKRKASSQAHRKVSRTRREFRESMELMVTGPKESKPVRTKLAVGDTVRLKGIRQTGKLSRFLSDDLIEVEAGFLKLQVSVDEVEEVIPAKEAKARLPKNVTLQSGPKAYINTQEVNVIGKRAEEARDEVDKFLDSAVLGEVDRVRIIHGHGMGVLKKMVGELLKTNPHVAKYYPATPAEGGTGATIAELKE
jgi:DNA mismatch repair protein MutS2